MNCRILDDCRNRIRIGTGIEFMPCNEADALEYYLRRIDGVEKVTVHERTGNIIIIHNGQNKSIIFDALASYSGAKREGLLDVPASQTRLVNREFEDKMASLVAATGLKWLLVPAPLKVYFAAYTTIRYIIRGIKSLKSKKLKVEVLDATSITVSFLRGSFSSVTMISFLLGVGDLLEDWTKKRAVSDLAESMSLNVDKVWLVKGDQEIQVPVADVRDGDEIVIRAGNVIPLDGKVVSGEAFVNQASMTGEAMPVRKDAGAPVYAGTVLEEGECVVKIEQANGLSRYERIVSMIEDSEKLKSATESKAMNLADKFVPYSLAGTAAVYAVTRNVEKAVAVLMVDYSCALKLAMPLCVLSAMRECGDKKVVVKGGKFLEAAAKADTIVFDKTGTLTNATPKVASVVAFNGYNKKQILRIAACLEEHFPHSIANAVVREAEAQNVKHREMHSEVEYIVAHGIASKINGNRAIIGSEHFVFEDEKCVIPESEQEKYDTLPDQYSQLYLALDGVLCGVILIEDPLRPEVCEVLKELKKLGIKKTVMMTGDNERTAAAIAKQAGIDKYYAEVLPEDKARYVRELREAGHTVIMIGDGINDSPALSEADVGIAIGEGAAIAREIADITIEAESLSELVFMRKVAMALQKRINRNYRFIMGFNSLLIVLGVGGIIAPATSALLHNISTIGVGLQSMTNLINEDAEA